MAKPLLRFENSIGVDEAGRGPLAGPVSAAAVWIPDDFDIHGIQDSKKLSPDSRRKLATRIQLGCKYAVEFVMPREIDQINILWASMRAMTLAVTKLLVQNPELGSCKGLVDGNRVPPDLPIAGEWMIKGDGKAACIAAASILAKTARDDYMAEMAIEYPQYGFESHFGYPTPAHFDAIRHFGPCEIHRLSFRPFVEPELNF